MNRKALLANLIGSFIALFIGVMLFSQIQYEISEAFCLGNTTNGTRSFNQTSLPPKGETNSFGGAGSDYHFGGYDGEVHSRSFNPIETYQAAGDLCDGVSVSSYAQFMLTLVPFFFLGMVTLISIATAVVALRNAGAI